eukprot:c40187_g1_i1.p1 GENE.c40187_g1_i1~~c40187_g1_i1.p1  ORF type:complete len:572 (-),score=132.17 c40187_g1_i1:166-1881(-)
MIGPVLATIKQAQMQNGLRNNDYLRYSQYCSRRLTRLRRSLGLNHGKRAFQKVELSAEKITDPRALLIPLISAERCWAYSMFLKEDQAQAPGRVRFHVRRRLTKAVTHTQRFLELCQTLADDRTKIEAEAHHNWMSANVAFESSLWDKALKHYRHAKAVFEKLALVGSEEESALYRQRVDEDIEPVIRFCLYNLRQEGVSEGEADEIQDLAVGADALLRAKIDTAMEERRRKQAESMESVVWRGNALPVRNDKIRICILEAQVTGAKAAETDEFEKRMETYDKVLGSLNDSLGHLRTEVLAVSNDKTRVGQLDQLKAYLTHQLLTATVQRDRAMVGDLRAKLEHQATAGAGSSKNKYAAGKPVQPEDLISMYERLIQSMNEFTSLPGYHASAEESAVEGSIALYKALRCYFMAQTYSNAEKWSEAGALFARAGEYVPLARDAIKDADKQVVKTLIDVADLDWLERQAQVGASVPRAMALLKAHHMEDSIGGAVKNLSLLESEAPAQPTGLLERVHEFSSTAEAPHLISFPPALRPMPVKPILFDLAYDSIGYPDVSHRAPKRRKGLLGAFF